MLPVTTSPAALTALAEALALGAPEGYLRVFVDEGPPMAASCSRSLLVGQHLEQLADAHAVPRDHLARLVAAFEQAGAHPPTRQARHGGRAGADRTAQRAWLEVLGLLAEGQPNKAIAEELVITLDTVKSHLSHILDKLGGGQPHPGRRPGPGAGAAAAGADHHLERLRLQALKAAAEGL